MGLGIASKSVKPRKRGFLGVARVCSTDTSINEYGLIVGQCSLIVLTVGQCSPVLAFSSNCANGYSIFMFHLLKLFPFAVVH